MDEFERYHGCKFGAFWQSHPQTSMSAISLRKSERK
jgi:hypothetical protein